MVSFRRYTIRQCLMAFGAALVLPGLVFAAILLWRYADSERGRYEEEALGTARALLRVEYIWFVLYQGPTDLGIY